MTAGELLRIDLGLLRALPGLERIRIVGDVRHSGSGSSPLEPPFEGLSTRLRSAQLEAWDALGVKAELQRYLGVAVGPDAELPSVLQRHGWEPGQPMWNSVETGLGWEAFGSFAASSEGGEASEAQARRTAQRRLAGADRALADRVTLDPSPPGSSLLASSRDDLVQALAVLDLSGASADLDDSGEGRLDEPSGVAPWDIHPAAGSGFSLYGSFAEAADGGFDTEFDAVEKARERLVRHDPGLAERLDFDHESDGTGVHAQRRENLDEMLNVLGLHPSR